MKISTILQTVSAYSVFLPVLTSIFYVIRKGFRYDGRINLLVFYFLLSLGTQALMYYLAINGKSNLFIVRIFFPLEIFILGYFLLSFQINNKILRSIFSVLLPIAIVIIDFVWGEANSLPIESILIGSLIITILGMTTIPELRVDSKHENTFYYLVFAIMIYSVNNLVGYGFMQLAPGFALVIHGLVNISKNIIFCIGLVLIIRNKEK